MTQPPNRTWLLLALILLAATLPFAQVLGMGFVYDDHAQIEDNPHLRVWPGLARVFSSDVWSMTDVDTTSNYYRPFMWLAYKAVFSMAGLAPWAFHLLNLVLHAAVTAVVFFLSRKLWNDEAMAAIAALLFALHPAHIEPVAWIGAAPELAYTLFVLLGFYFYALDKLPERQAALGYLGCFAAGLLWKESAITLVPLVLAYDAIVLKRFRVGRYVAIGVVTLAYLSVRVLALGGLAPNVIRPGVSVAAQALTALSNLGFYLQKLILPTGLSLYYPVTIVSALNVTILIVTLVAAVGIWKLREKPAFATVWILVTLLPVLAVTRVAAPLADRNLYLASVGFCWMAAHALIALSRMWRPLPVAAAGLILSGYLAAVVIRVPDWSSDMALLQRALEIYPDNEAANLNLAAEYSRQHRYQEAITALDQILNTRPANVEALLTKAESLVFLQEWRGVQATCGQAFAVNANSPRCHLYEGLRQQAQGEVQKAWESFNLAYRGNARLWQAPFYQGGIAFAAGDLGTAEARYLDVIAKHPSAQVYNNLGSVYLRKDEREKAIEAYSRALEIDPSYETARINLSRLMPPR